MATINAAPTAVEKKKDWSELIFGFALSLWQSDKQADRLPKPNVSLQSCTRPLLSPRPREAGVICSCFCHCSLRSGVATPGGRCPCGSAAKDGSCVACATGSTNNVSGVTSSSVASNLHKDQLVSKPHHRSVDHVKCLKINKSVFNTRLCKMKFRSAGQEKKVCDTCACVLSPMVSNGDEVDAPAGHVAYAEVYDKRLGRVVGLDDLSMNCSIKQSNSDPTLNTSGYCHVDQNCNNENTCKFQTMNKRHKTLKSSFSNTSFGFKNNTSTISRMNKRNLSFRVSTKNLAKKLISTKVAEKVCESPANVKLSAINKLSNKPLEQLREQMDGKLPARRSFSNVSSNTTNKLTDAGCQLRDSEGGKLRDKSLTGSLRRRRKSFLRKSDKVRPVGGGEVRHSSAADVTGSVTRYSAWRDEFDDYFDDLHHKNCPCRSVAAPGVQQLKDEMADVTAEMETLDGGEDGKTNPKSKQMSIGRKKFNMDPKKGIEYLIEHGLLKNTADDISKFLYNGEGLNKTAIGDYLGERHDFNQTVLHTFVALHDFTDLILVQALRQFLWSFRLPGEAQKIDRMMERFASHYCELNPAIFQHPDTCFVLSFAIIMLNTSLHNPAVKDKQTLDQFVTMNRGIDNGDDLPKKLLESLYESIKTEPFKIPEDDGNDLMHTFFNPDREGWLWKQGGRYKSWKRRWFILNDNCLYYFEYTTDKEPRGIIPLENIEVREVHDRNKPHCFELYATSTDFIKACKTDSEGKVVEGKHTVYRMSAATHEEKEEWIKCIRQSISHNPFYDLLAKRKKNIQKNSS